MSAIFRTQERFGIRHIVDIVIGSDTKRIRALQHDKIKTYGAGRDKDKGHWRFIVDELFAQDVIRQEGDPYPVLKLTEKGKNILYGKEIVTALKRKRQRQRRWQRAILPGMIQPSLRYCVLWKRIAEESRCLHLLYFLTRHSMRCADTILQCLLK